jgi:osmotically-inducible protein OsmY
MKRSFLTLLSAFAIVGATYAQDPNADNTGNNKKATDGTSVTAGDQSNDPADIKTTAEIRKAVVADDSLSALAKNVKIITVSQVVTLRGPVETEKEKATVLALAKKAGASNVKDEITIKE